MCSDPVGDTKALEYWRENLAEGWKEKILTPIGNILAPLRRKVELIVNHFADLQPEDVTIYQRFDHAPVQSKST